MLFNSYIFLFIFLPIALGIFFLLGRFQRYQTAIFSLVVMSLVFYGWWSPIYLSLILASMVFNYLVGVRLGRRARGEANARGLLAFGVTADLVLLGYFKYAKFFVANLNSIAGLDYPLPEIVLPLGISFFTFTQIAYLVDSYRGEAREYNPLHYALFVTYFPHLIAGPVLHHKEMMPQFAKPAIYVFNTKSFTAGTTYFLIGLFKKVVIADGVSVFANPVFAAATKLGAVSFADAWGGALSYTFQLYFDFSGYSDMAVGLAMMMGICLPLNFDSPYKAPNIIEFWRRWHMTLSRFLRDYLYFALGGNRHGEFRRYVNLFLTMLLGGLWHGAGWTFIAWGALHGAYLMANHAWHGVRRRFGQDSKRSSPVGRWVARTLTFIAVVIGWVFFRAHDIESAVRMLQAMFSPPSFSLSSEYAQVVTQSKCVQWMALLGLPLPGPAVLLTILIGLLGVVWIWPNTQELMNRDYRELDGRLDATNLYRRTEWRPNWAWLGILLVASVWSLLGLSSVSEFLYFQF